LAAIRDFTGFVISAGKKRVKYYIDMSKALDLIQFIYGSKIAKRSGVPLINHIKEGIKILNIISSDFWTIEAYCIHPICQSPELFTQYFKELYNLDSKVVLLGMEYRTVANNWLCGMPKPSNPLSVIKEVNEMLIADKIQNRKDFELYHKGTHPNSDNLDKYFKDWLQELGVSEDKYQEIVKIL
jgi:hypothetical protein